MFSISETNNPLILLFCLYNFKSTVLITIYLNNSYVTNFDVCSKLQVIWFITIKTFNFYKLTRSIDTN